MWGHGIPWGIPRDPAGNFEGNPAGPHGIPWMESMVFPWHPAGTIGITHGIPWDTICSRGASQGSRGSLMGSRGSHGTLWGFLWFPLEYHSVK